MSRDNNLSNQNFVSGAVRGNGDEAPRAPERAATRAGCTRSWRDSACAPANAGR